MGCALRSNGSPPASDLLYEGYGYRGGPTQSARLPAEAFTVWESMATTLGSSARPREQRSLRRSNWWIRSVVLSSRTGWLLNSAPMLHLQRR